LVLDDILICLENCLDFNSRMAILIIRKSFERDRYNHFIYYVNWLVEANHVTDLPARITV
jgi:hypothetical protein